MAGGGGAWKVAYADFVTAMMAFFMVMWLVGQNSKMKEAVAEHFQHDPLDDLFGNESFDEERKSGGTRKGNGRFGKLKGDSAKIPSPSESPQDPPDEKARILSIHDSERTIIGAMVPFAEHSAELTEEGTRRLNELIPLIDGKPHKIEVRGHCTASPAAGEQTPDEFWNLAYARALQTQHYMQSHGIAAERIRLSVAGQYEPFTIDEDRDRQRRNERVEVYLLNEYATDFQGTRQERERRFTQESYANNRPAAAESPDKTPAHAEAEEHPH